MQREQQPKPVYTFEGIHENVVSAMALSLDSKLLATGSYDKSIKVFDLEKRELLLTLKNAHTNWIMSLAFSHSGKFLISGSYDNSIKLFDLDTRATAQHFKNAHEGAVRSVAVSPNDGLIVSGSDDKSIKVFDLEENQLLHTFQNAHKNRVMSVVISSDGRWIVSTSDDKSIKIFDLERLEPVYTFANAHEKWIVPAIISWDKSLIVSGSYDKSIKVFDTQRKTVLQHIRTAHDHTVLSLAFSPSQKYVVSASADKTIRIFDIQTGELVHYIPDAHNDAINVVAVTSNGKYIISASSDQTVRIFDFPVNLEGQTGNILPEKIGEKKFSPEKPMESVITTKKPEPTTKTGFNFKAEMGNYLLNQFSSEIERAKALKNELKEEMKQRLIRETGLQAITHDMLREQLQLLEHIDEIKKKKDTVSTDMKSKQQNLEELKANKEYKKAEEIKQVIKQEEREIIHFDVERTDTMNQLFKVEKLIRNNMQDIDTLLDTIRKELESFKMIREKGNENIRKEDELNKSNLRSLIEEFKKECRTLGQELNSQAEKDDIQADTCDDVVSRISATASKIQTLRGGLATLRKREEATSIKLKAENLFIEQADDVLNSVSKLNATLKERESEREEILAKIPPLITEVAQHLQDVEKRTSDLENMSNEIKALQKVNYELSKLITSSESSMIDHKNNLKAYEEAENFEVLEQMKHAEEEMKQLKIQYEQRNQEIRGKLDKYQELDQERKVRAEALDKNKRKSELAVVAFLKYKKEELAFYRDLYTFVELTQVYPLLDKSIEAIDVYIKSNSKKGRSQGNITQSKMDISRLDESSVVQGGDPEGDSKMLKAPKKEGKSSKKNERSSPPKNVELSIPEGSEKSQSRIEKGLGKEKNPKARKDMVKQQFSAH